MNESTVALAYGRAFGADDEVRGRHRVVVLGHAYWQQQFVGASNVVGRTLDLRAGPPVSIRWWHCATSSAERNAQTVRCTELETA